MYISHVVWKVGNYSGSLPNSEASQKHSKPPASLSRRLTAMGRMVLDFLTQSQAFSKKEGVPWVVSSQHGDTKRMVRLFDHLAQKETLSPTDFSQSVHNAIVGGFSIATQNKKTHTALSGANHSFQMGLLEAIALCKDLQSQVGYIYYDTPLPDIYEKAIEEQYVLLIIEPEVKNNFHFKLKYCTKESDIRKLFLLHDLTKYFESDEPSYTIPYPGGEILLQRPAQATQ